MPIQSSTGRYNNIDLYAYSLYCISRKGCVGPMGKVKEYILVWPDPDLLLKISKKFHIITKYN